LGIETGTGDGTVELTNETTDQGVTERSFEVAAGGENVPGIAWSPEARTIGRPS